MAFELSLPSAWSNFYQQIVTEFLLCTRDLSFQQDKASILRKLSENSKNRKDSKNKAKSIGGEAGEGPRIMSIKCAVSRKLFRDGLIKELSSL